MAKKVEVTDKFDIDDSMEIPVVKVEKEEVEIPKKYTELTSKAEKEDKPLVNCLRKERIIVRHIPKESGSITNPKHILYGGMSETAKRVFVVPMLSSGMFANVLTDNEKAFLEDVMGLEHNALSVYKKVDNFWDDTNDKGVSRVMLSKQDTYFDLSDPEDYIRYKILLANKDYIAPSLQALQDYPKASYQFVIIGENEETKSEKNNMSTTMKCYKEFGKIETDADTLRVVIETIDGRPLATNTKLEFLQTKINTLIQADNKLFLKVITDPMLQTKVLIKKCIEAGIISKRGNYLYVREDNTPLCEANEEPTLNVAAKYLNSPKHQDLLFSLQAKVE